MTEFLRKRIRLPQERYVGRYWYFVTLCTQGRRDWFLDPDSVQQVRVHLDASARSKAFQLPAYCFMPDHLHLLASGLEEESDLRAFMKNFKQRSAFQFKGKSGQQLWQRYFYEHILRSEDKWEAVAWYIWMNPVRKGLCESPILWPYSGSQQLDWKTLMKSVDPDWIPPWKKRP